MPRPLVLIEDDGHLRVATLDDLRDVFRTVAVELLDEIDARGPQLVTVARAAEVLECEPRTIKARIEDGTLPAVDLADPSSARRHWRIDLTKAARLITTPCTCSDDPTMPCEVHPTVRRLAS